MGEKVTNALLQATATITAAETVIGKEIGCAYYDTITIFMDYTNGDETGLFVIPYVFYERDGDAYQWQSWSTAAGDKTSASNRFSMTATGKYYGTLDIRGIAFVEFRMDADGGTPTGTLKASITMTAEG